MIHVYLDVSVMESIYVIKFRFYRAIPLGRPKKIFESVAKCMGPGLGPGPSQWPGSFLENVSWKIQHVLCVLWVS